MDMPRKPEAHTPLNGSETIFIIQNGRIRRLTMNAVLEELGLINQDIEVPVFDTPDPIDIDKLKQEILGSIKIPEFKHRRVEFLSTTTGKQVTFSNPFSKTPIVIRQSTWGGSGNNQHIIPFIVNINERGITLGAKISRGAFLLNGSPYTDAPNDTPVEVVLVEQF